MRLFDVVALARRHVVTQREVRHAENGVHRRADLVRHVGEKARFDAGSRLRGVPRIAHRLLRLFFQRDVVRDQTIELARALQDGHDRQFDGERRAVAAQETPFAALRPPGQPRRIQQALRGARAVRAVGLLRRRQRCQPGHAPEQPAFLAHAEQLQRGRITAQHTFIDADKKVAVERVLEHRAKLGFSELAFGDVRPVTVVQRTAAAIRRRRAVALQPALVVATAYRQFHRADRWQVAAGAHHAPGHGRIGGDGRDIAPEQRFGAVADEGEVALARFRAVVAEHRQRQGVCEIQQLVARPLDFGIEPLAARPEHEQQQPQQHRAAKARQHPEIPVDGLVLRAPGQHFGNVLVETFE